MFIQNLVQRAPTLASLDDTASPAVLAARQATTTIETTAVPAGGCGGSYSGGTLAGAILGTFFGTLLIIYMFSVIQPAIIRRSVTVEEVTVEKKRRHTSRS